MHVVLAWVAAVPPSQEWRAAARRRVDAGLAPLLPDTYRRVDLGGDDWGLTVARCPEGAWRWPAVETDGDTTAVSLGVPIGLDLRGGPVGLARRLLRGDDVHAGGLPPYGLLALEHGRRLVAQQDWLGMSRLFTGTRDGVTVLCSRPSLAAELLGGPPRPDHDGWASYVSAGHFAGDSSPVAGIRLLRPGERVSARRDGGWKVATEIRHSVRDVVTAGSAVRRGGVAAALDLAAHGLAATVTSVADLYGGDLTLGLSGGKDSRLIAAAFIAAGRVPAFITNEDTAVEGDTARELVRVLRERRGVAADHTLARTGTAAVVQRLGLRERIRRLQLHYDYQYPSTYTVRHAGGPRLPAAPGGLSLGGAGGELAIGYWYPAEDPGRAEAEQTVRRKLLPAGAAPISEAARSGQHRRFAALLDDAAALGLAGPELLDYGYLMERLRRWITSAYHLNMVSPFLAPDVVSATFALTPRQKRDRLLHAGLLERFVPEWTQIPYVSRRSGPSTATRIWDGDGLPAVHELLDTTGGDLVRLLRRDAIERALVASARGDGTVGDEKALQQFACLAAAAQRLEPDGVRPPTRSYAAFLAAAPARRQRRVPAVVSALATRLSFVKRTRAGRLLWDAARLRLTGSR